MNDFIGYQYSFAGFVDYSKCYTTVNPLWLTVQICVTVGTVASVIPQWINIVKGRSNFGLNSITIWITSWGQFLLVLNYIVLHAATFIGVIQLPASVTWQKFMSFVNLFALWICYLAVPFLDMIFFDLKIRKRRQMKAIKAEQILTNVMHPLLILGFTICFVISSVLGTTKSFFHQEESYYAKVVGLISAALVIAQYLPQMITTCRLRNHGALSLIMLAIQAPGGTINSFSMIFGQGDDWSTWLSLLLGASQQFILLGICLYYKCKRKRDGATTDQLLQQNTGDSMPSINAFSGRYTE